MNAYYITDNENGQNNKENDQHLIETQNIVSRWGICGNDHL